jgi:hypothetical protein
MREGNVADSQAALLIAKKLAVGLTDREASPYRDFRCCFEGQTETVLAAAGRYPSVSYLRALARGFAAFERGDFAAVIQALAPLAGRNERIGGSRAQHDLIEFTLLQAYLGSRRLEEASGCLAHGVPVLPAFRSRGSGRSSDHRGGEALL